VQRLQEAEADAQQKVAEIARRYGPQHSVMIAAQSELARATENLLSQERSVAKSIRSDFEAARAEEAELVKALDRAKQEYQEIGRKESELMALQREAKTNRSLYELFYNRLTETAATGDLKSMPARIIAPAVLPSKPTSPKKLLIVCLVFIISILVGVLAAFLLNAINNTIRTAHEVERLNVPLLGMLPLLKARRRRQTSMGHVFFDSSETEFNEAIRTIRTGITLNSMDNPNRVILVTSSLSGEGKSTVALNLAFAFAKMEKVLLIDADMRRPSIAKEFGLPADRPGLAELISGEAKFLQCVVRRKKENLDVISAGVVPENPLERLSAHQLKQLLQALRTRFDRIIIDSPPLLPVSDSAVLSTYADSVVFVVKSDSTTVQQARDALEKLHRAKGTVAGIVINQLDMKQAGYGGYGYGSYTSDLPPEVPALPNLRVVK
jgi:succinoglycan biosynthesis transport protein ExoP